MYPDAQGSLIEYVVIDGNSGECKANLTFSGEEAGGEYALPHGSSNNVIRYSLITNSRCRYNVESYYPSGSLTPVGNLVEYSCVWNAPWGNWGYLTTDAGAVAYTERNNLDVNPLYVNLTRKDFNLQAGSPCTGWGPRTTPEPIPLPTTTTTTTTSPRTTTATTTTTTTTTTIVPSPDFSLSASPSSQSVARGSQASFLVSVNGTNGFSGSVNLSVSGAPSGAVTSFNPNPISSSSTLRVDTSSKTKRGSYTLTITGSSAGGAIRKVLVNLKVQKG
jgi:hypothetical protein